MWRYLAGALTIVSATMMPAAPPNVVLIISDDQAWGDFGFMGHEVIRTPNLDRLASQSAFFPRGYVTCALCRASLASIITGLYGHQTKICGNDPPPGTDRKGMLKHLRDVPTLPRMLGKAGYRSFQTGKFWEGPYANGGFTHGMTTEGRHGGPGLTIGRQGMKPIFDFIDESGDTPFFVWYAPFLPHNPHNPPPRLLKKYAVEGRNLKLAKYWAMCEWLDDTCGELLDYLDEKKLTDNTLVIFVVDNGWIQETGDARTTRGAFAPKSKLSPNEGGVRTPILLRWPGRIKPGQRGELVSAIDLAPTILRACGLAPTQDMQGVNLLDLMAGRVKRTPDAVFGELFGHNDVAVGRPVRNLTHRWLRRGDWKLIVPQDESAAPELYNVTQDPAETRNLAADHPERVRQLGTLLDRWWTPVE